MEHKLASSCPSITSIRSLSVSCVVTVGYFSLMTLSSDISMTTSAAGRTASQQCLNSGSIIPECTSWSCGMISWQSCAERSNKRPRLSSYDPTAATTLPLSGSRSYAASDSYQTPQPPQGHRPGHTVQSKNQHAFHNQKSSYHPTATPSTPLSAKGPHHHRSTRSRLWIQQEHPECRWCFRTTPERDLPLSCLNWKNHAIAGIVPSTLTSDLVRHRWSQSHKLPEVSLTLAMHLRVIINFHQVKAQATVASIKRLSRRVLTLRMEQQMGEKLPVFHMTLGCLQAAISQMGCLEMTLSVLNKAAVILMIKAQEEFLTVLIE